MALSVDAHFLFRLLLAVGLAVLLLTGASPEALLMLGGLALILLFLYRTLGVKL